MALRELLEGWDRGDGKPMKGSLIDMGAWEKGAGNCAMCAQGQVLHIMGGWTPEQLNDATQSEADKESAKILNISVAHTILLRNVNDRFDGAPSIVLDAPAKVLGDQWSKLLDFWWHLDQMTAEQWASAWAAAGDAAGAAAGDAAGASAGAAAGDAAWASAWAAAGDAAGAAAGAVAWDAAGASARDAAGEIQGAQVYKNAKRPFYFLPLFGFETPDDIPARPSNYGEPV